MKKKLYTLLAIFTLTLVSSITAFAAPEVMPDGGMFDAEYYAQNNPDVVAAFGTDKELLYSHYVNCGKAEGRLAVAPVELTKEKMVTGTEKRKQLDTEIFYGDYPSYVYDKAGYSFETRDVKNYFNDADLEKFNNMEELINFVATIELYDYADKISFANSYYYQDLKNKALASALSSVDSDYWQFHYQTNEYYFSMAEGRVVYQIMYQTLKPFYGENTTSNAWCGSHSKNGYYGGTNIRQAAAAKDGCCVGIGVYRSKEQKEMYYDNWKKTIG